MKPTTQSIPAKARTCRLWTRFICGSSALFFAALEDAAVNPIRRHRRVMETDSGGVGQRVRECRRDRINRRLAHGLGAEWTERVVGLRKVDFVALRNVGKSRDAIIA